MPAELCSRIIYKFECESCKDFYIGSTMKQSKVCFCQHLGISHRTIRPTIPYLIPHPDNTVRKKIPLSIIQFFYNTFS